MTLGTQNLRDQITTRLAASPSGLACCQLQGAQTILNAASVTCVANLAALPDVVHSVGRFFFVEDIGAYRYSNGEIYTNDYDTTVGSVESAGILLTWGAGNTGDPAVGGRCIPGTTAGGLVNWCQVSTENKVSSVQHAGAVGADGTLWTWGDGGSGQLGNNSTISQLSPINTIAGGTTWCQVVTIQNVTGAIKTDGTLWTWGNNSLGTLGTNTTVNRSSPGTVVNGGNNWCYVTAGYGMVGAIKSDGTLWTWGFNGCGALGDNSQVGRSSPGTTSGGGTTWCQSTSGRFNTGAVKTDGTLWTWGNNSNGQLGDGTLISRSSPGTTAGGGSNWCQTNVGAFHWAAVKTDGTLWTWGLNSNGQLGDGTVVAKSSPVSVVGGATTWCITASGESSTGAIKTDGTLWTWGTGTLLGTGSNIARSSPGTTAGGGTTWCTLTSSRQSMAAIQVVSKGFNPPT